MKKVYLNTLKPEEIIKRLKNGEVAKFDGANYTISMIDGVMVKKDKNEIGIGWSITVDEVNDYYFEEEESFNVSCTGRYKTRDGRLVFVSRIDPTRVVGIVDGEEVRTIWFPDGRFHFGGQDELDIVAKWED